MYYLNKPFLKSVFISTLSLLPITMATSNDLPQQVNRLQTNLMESQVNRLQLNLMETNEKIAALTSDQQRITGTISTLQARLDTAHQEISDLRNSGAFRPNQLNVSDTKIHRTANGHGRGRGL
jgi:peptidoglycan hydrolase CwlO-like protein